MGKHKDKSADEVEGKSRKKKKKEKKAKKTSEEHPEEG